MKELTHASVAELSALLSKKEVSAKEIAQAYLDKIEDKKSLNAFLDVRPEVTLKEAEAADRKIRRHGFSFNRRSHCTQRYLCHAQLGEHRREQNARKLHEPL